jgi:MFS family permease
MFRSGSGLRHNLLLDLGASVGIGVTVAMVVTLLPSAARQEGLSPIGLAALASTPFVANLLGAFAGRIGARSVRQLALYRAGGAAALLLMLPFPSPLTMVVVSLLYWLSISLPGPFHVTLWGQLYPAHARGRILSLFGAGKAAASASAALVGGILAVTLGAPVVFAVAGVIGLVFAVAYAGLRASEQPRVVRFTAAESVRVLLAQPVLRRVATAHAFYGAGVVAAVPLFALVHVDRLALSLADVGLIGIVGAASTTLAFPIWGAATDRIGSLTVLRMGTALGLVAVAIYAGAPGIAPLLFAAAALGAGSAAIDTSFVALLSEKTSLDSRAPAMAGWNALSGAWGISAPFAMTFLIQAGILDVRSGLVACVAVASVGIGLYLTAGEAEGQANPVRTALTSSWRGLRIVVAGAIRQ